jgi:hypothetical protein
MGIPYLWRVNNSYPDKLIGEYDYNGPDYLLLRQAKVLGPEFGIPEVRVEGRLEELGKVDNLYNNTGFPLVNDRLRTFLTERVPEDLQFLPTRVLAADGETVAFMLLNALHFVQAIDHDNTVFEFMTDGKTPLGFKKLTHLPDRMGDRGLAREAEYKGHLLVADWLAEELMAHKFTGFALKRATDMDW